MCAKQNGAVSGLVPISGAAPLGPPPVLPDEGAAFSL